MRKIRGFGRNRTRWFRLTQKFFAYYTHDGGSLIAFVPRQHIVGIDDLPTTGRFVVRTSVSFGATGGQQMLLEAKNARVSCRGGGAVSFTSLTRVICSYPLSPFPFLSS